MVEKSGPPATIHLFTARNPFHAALFNKFGKFSEQWKPLDHRQWTDFDQRAILALNKAGLIEIRLGAEVRWIGYPYLLQVIFEVTGKDTQPEVIKQLRELAAGAPGWVDDGVAQCPIKIAVWPIAGRLTARGVTLSPPRHEVLNILELVIDDKLPSCSPSVNLIDFQMWTPSELQREIWNKLNRLAMTADKLHQSLVRSRATLFRDRGLPEMLELGLLKNDRMMGGYYRPDAPPEE